MNDITKLFKVLLDSSQHMHAYNLNT